MRLIVTHSFTFRANSTWVDERADSEDRNLLDEGWKHAAGGLGSSSRTSMLAFAMGGCHGLGPGLGRLGERSQIRAIKCDVLISIGKKVLNGLGDEH